MGARDKACLDALDKKNKTGVTHHEDPEVDVDQPPPVADPAGGRGHAAGAGPADAAPDP
ncbi:hypothetical protein EMIT047CA2_120053 [Pseudomonas soli]